jgi:hypothetical protein
MKNFSNFYFIKNTSSIPIASIALIVGTILGWATSLKHGSDVRAATLIVKPYPLVFPIKQIFVHMNEIIPY